MAFIREWVFTPLREWTFIISLTGIDDTAEGDLTQF